MSSTQMQDKAGSTMMLAVPETEQAAGWQVQAIEKYERSLPAGRAGLREELAARILVLTGLRVSSEDAYADASGRLAVAGVDGTTLRLYRGGDLVMVRSCAYCETGRFESPQISDVADFGYALGVWRPLHEDCEDQDGSENLAGW